jgi:hypothetical protein
LNVTAFDRVPGFVAVLLFSIHSSSPSQTSWVSTSSMSSKPKIRRTAIAFVVWPCFFEYAMEPAQSLVFDVSCGSSPL